MSAAIIPFPQRPSACLSPAMTRRVRVIAASRNVPSEDFGIVLDACADLAMHGASDAAIAAHARLTADMLRAPWPGTA